MIFCAIWPQHVTRFNNLFSIRLFTSDFRLVFPMKSRFIGWWVIILPMMLGRTLIDVETTEQIDYLNAWMKYNHLTWNDCLYVHNVERNSKYLWKGSMRVVIYVCSFTLHISCEKWILKLKSPLKEIIEIWKVIHIVTIIFGSIALLDCQPEWAP